jgi:hypothetical protein
MFPNTALNSISPDGRMMQAFPNIFFLKEMAVAWRQQEQGDVSEVGRENLPPTGRLPSLGVSLLTRIIPLTIFARHLGFPAQPCTAIYERQPLQHWTRELKRRSYSTERGNSSQVLPQFIVKKLPHGISTFTCLRTG